MKERGSVRSTLESDPRTPTVKLNWIIVQPCHSRKELTFLMDGVAVGAEVQK
jgi:hypothetical protein